MRMPGWPASPIRRVPRRRTPRCGARTSTSSSADFATGNLYALAWLLAQARPTPAEQAATFSRFALFVQNRGWIGARCLDITKVATVVGAPPKVEACH